MNDLPVSVYAVGRPDVPACRMPARFRTDVAYFGTPPGRADAGPATGEYLIDAAAVDEWIATGVLTLVSPLDAAHVAEVEITEDQERFILWLREHSVARVRVE